MVRAAILSLLAVNTMTRALDGQERSPVRTNIVVAAERWNLTPGQMLRIYTSGVGFVEGSIDALRDQELLVRSGATQTAIRLAWIDSLWVRTSAAKRGAVFGGAGGSVLGAVIGVVVCRSDCDRAGTIVIGALLGAGGGAVGGAAVGSRHRIWSRRYP